MALSERFDKQTRINEVKVAYIGNPERADQSWRRRRAESCLDTSSENTYNTETAF